MYRYNILWLLEQQIPNYWYYTLMFKNKFLCNLIFRELSPSSGQFSCSAKNRFRNKEIRSINSMKLNFFSESNTREKKYTKFPMRDEKTDSWMENWKRNQIDLDIHNASYWLWYRIFFATCCLDSQTTIIAHFFRRGITRM